MWTAVVNSQLTQLDSIRRCEVLGFGYYQDATTAISAEEQNALAGDEGLAQNEA